MGSKEPVPAHGHTVRATLCEIEHGVFRASYSDRASGKGDLPLYELGASVADARRRIEGFALSHGYDAVIWCESLGAATFGAEALAAP